MYSSTIGTMLTAASFSTIAAAKPSWSSWAESPLFSSEPCFGDRWDSVREAELGPGDFLELALRLLPTESDESLAQSLVGHVAAGMHRYVNPTVRAEMVPRAEMLASDQMLHSPNQ